MPGTRKKKPPKYPEHVKQEAILDSAHEIGDFLTWLKDQTLYRLATWACPGHDPVGSTLFFHEHATECDDPELVLQGYTDSWITRLVAQYFEIDLDVIEKEKQAMLEEISEARELKGRDEE